VKEVRTKRGDTFSLAGTRVTQAGVPVNLAGYQVRAQMRDGADSLVYAFAPTVTNAAAGEFRLDAPATTTETWTPARYVVDIEFVSSGGVVDSSDTFRIVVVPDITR
jgi:hypothetical protein